MLADVNGDDVVDMDDALEILNYVLEIENIINTDPVAAKVADVNGDGEVNMDDALEILNYVLEIGSEYIK